MKLTTPLLLICLFVVPVVNAEIVTKDVEYKQGDTIMKGMIAYDDAVKQKRPGVIIVHEWWGHNKHARDKAIKLAEAGYVGFAIDMYGDGKTAGHPDDAGKFSKAVATNMPLAKARFEAAMNTLKAQNNVDADNLAAMGYCFGGGVVLNMARMGVELKGVSSFHGSIGTDSPASKGDIKTRVRVFNGEADSFVKAEQIAALKIEMKNAGVDFEFVNYPGAKHSFTNPGADATGKKFGLPLEYNAQADKDSWNKNLQFLKEIFTK